MVPSGKRAVASAIWPLSTRVKRSRISGVGVPTMTVRVTSVVPSGYCAAGIDQEHLVVVDRRVGRARHAVMHDGAVGPRAGNGIEGQVLQAAGGAAKPFQRFRGVDFGQRAVGRLAREPGRESATAPRRRGYAPCACLRSPAGSCRPWATGRDRRAFFDFRARLGKPVEDRRGRGGGIGEHGLALQARPARRSNRRRGRQAHAVAQMGDAVPGERLALVQEQIGRAVGVQDGEAPARTACAARRCRGC